MKWVCPTSAALACLLTLGARAGQTPPAIANRDPAAPSDVATPPPGAQKTPSGVVTEVLKAGDGDQHPTENDCVLMVFKAWRRDGTLFSVSGAYGEAATQCLRPAMPGVAEALKLMVTGEKRRVWVPASLTTAMVMHHGNKHIMAPEEPKVDLTFDLELVHIFRAPPTPDLTPPAHGAVKLSSGVFEQVLDPGTGTTHPALTSWLTVDYTGWTRDGVLFESTVLAGHSRLVQFGMTLPGWQEALRKMVAGEKVRLWIPGAQAYGMHPASKLVPAGDLIYDIQLVSIDAPR
jgi:FKBP-type peptidyl-prolyl cis-trans isomerase